MPPTATPSSPALRLLLLDAERHEPVLPGGLSDGSARGQRAPERAPAPEYLWSRGGDPNDLRCQRWGIIAPVGAVGDHLLELIAPLLKLRTEQQGAPVKVYRAPPLLDLPGAAAWRKRDFDRGQALSLELPRYQLILGDLDQVPLSVQQVQGTDGFVGRLAFAEDAGYTAYVDKLLAHERRGPPPAQAQGRALFYTAHGSLETEQGYQQLVAPSVQLLEQARHSGGLRATGIADLGQGASKPADLLRAASDDDPTVLFTMSHGVGPGPGGWPSAAAQRQQQGAMGFRKQPPLSAPMLAGQRFLPGGLWFMFACYGAGTPATSAYRHWLEQLAASGQFSGDVSAVLRGLARPGDRPFVAALPQAALASREGPLGFIGHIDLAWSYSFNELGRDGQSRPGRFADVVHSLLAGDRFGNAFSVLPGALNMVQSELSSLYDQDAAMALGVLDPTSAPGSRPDPARRGHLWMLRQDLAGYVLLGDPAARLHLPSATAPVPQPASTDQLLAQLFPFAGGRDPQAPAAPAASADIDRFEPAVLRVLLGLRSAEALAAEYQLDLADLQAAADAYRAAGRAAAARTLEQKKRT